MKDLWLLTNNKNSFQNFYFMDNMICSDQTINAITVVGSFNFPNIMHGLGHGGVGVQARRNEIDIGGAAREAS